MARSRKSTGKADSESWGRPQKPGPSQGSPCIKTYKNDVKQDLTPGFFFETDYLYLIVSKKAKHAEQIVADFNKGLAIIEKDGRLKRIYRESGF